METTAFRKKGLLAASMLLLSTSIASAAADAGMQETSDYVVGAASIAGLIFIIAINLLWIIFPAGTGYMTYSYFKRKSEQSQEDNGLKAGVGVFFSVLVGFMAAYFIVGSIGKAASDGAHTLADGNKYVVKSFLGAMIDKFDSQLRNNP
ncbi:MAG TPA: hypothetical protein ENN12_03475 [Epsilonproteobacteria bacterium]|nr:hypothetical protein [Campylobacterota bacterium]